MNKKDAIEAAPIMQRSLDALVKIVPSSGRGGSDLRVACGRLSANAEALIQADAAGPPLAECFDLARFNGATQDQLAVVRNATLAETPSLLGAILIKNSIVRMCLSAEGRLIADMQLTSRVKIDALMAQMNTVFDAAEEIAADDMDQATFQSLVALHAAITGFLTETERPLPRMLRFAFAASMPSLSMAQRLYWDASRADELRDENNVVHPAFMKPRGLALSA